MAIGDENASGRFAVTCSRLTIGRAELGYRVLRAESAVLSTQHRSNISFESHFRNEPIKDPRDDLEFVVFQFETEVLSARFFENVTSIWSRFDQF